MDCVQLKLPGVLKKIAILATFTIKILCSGQNATFPFSWMILEKKLLRLLRNNLHFQLCPAIYIVFQKRKLKNLSGLLSTLCYSLGGNGYCIISALYHCCGFCLSKTLSFLHSTAPTFSLVGYSWRLTCGVSELTFSGKWGLLFAVELPDVLDQIARTVFLDSHKGKSSVRLVSYQSLGCVSGNKLTRLRYFWLICSSS